MTTWTKVCVNILFGESKGKIKVDVNNILTNEVEG